MPAPGHSRHECYQLVGESAGIPIHEPSRGTIFNAHFYDNHPHTITHGFRFPRMKRSQKFLRALVCAAVGVIIAYAVLECPKVDKAKCTVTRVKVDDELTDRVGNTAYLDDGTDPSDVKHASDWSDEGTAADLSEMELANRTSLDLDIATNLNDASDAFHEVTKCPEPQCDLFEMWEHWRYGDGTTLFFGSASIGLIFYAVTYLFYTLLKNCGLLLCPSITGGSSLRSSTMQSPSRTREGPTQRRPRTPLAQNFGVNELLEMREMRHPDYPPGYTPIHQSAPPQGPPPVYPGTPDVQNSPYERPPSYSLHGTEPLLHTDTF